jgi:hypothetical protein
MPSRNRPQYCFRQLVIAPLGKHYFVLDNYSVMFQRRRSVYRASPSGNDLIARSHPIGFDTLDWQFDRRSAAEQLHQNPDATFGVRRFVNDTLEPIESSSVNSNLLTASQFRPCLNQTVGIRLLHEYFDDAAIDGCRHIIKADDPVHSGRPLYFVEFF